MIFLTLFGGNAVVTIIVIGVLVIAFELCVEFVFSNDHVKSVLKSVGKAIFIAGLALLFHLTLENVEKLEGVKKELADVNQKASAFEFFKPYETILSLDNEPSFQKLLLSQMQQTRDRLKQIEKGQLKLSREEIIPVWEALISKYASKQIKATNVVSVNDWKKFSPNQGLEAHEEFLSKDDTRFQRLFIYDSSDSLSRKGTSELAKRQMDMVSRLKKNGKQNIEERFQMRFIDKKSIDNTTYGNTMYSYFGTLDLVLFDNECLLQTVTQYKNNAYEMVNGVVSNDRALIDKANEMFDKLWEKAQSFNEFK